MMKTFPVSLAQPFFYTGTDVTSGLTYTGRIKEVRRFDREARFVLADTGAHYAGGAPIEPIVYGTLELADEVEAAQLLLPPAEPCDGCGAEAGEHCRPLSTCTQEAEEAREQQARWEVEDDQARREHEAYMESQVSY